MVCLASFGRVKLFEGLIGFFWLLDAQPTFLASFTISIVWQKQVEKVRMKGPKSYIGRRLSMCH